MDRKSKLRCDYEDLVVLVSSEVFFFTKGP